MNDTREKLATRLGFILLSAGCAIGLGNVWRFPYVTGQSGGGWFVLIYLVALALVGLPVLVMEFAAGRAAQRSVAVLHGALTPEKPAWRIHGVAGAVGCLVLMSFYTVVTGWMLIYFCRAAGGAFAGLTAETSGAAFGAMLANAPAQVVAMLTVTWGALAVCAVGLQKGLERVTKALMLVLLGLIVILAVHSMLLPGAGKGLRFFLVPDFARMREAGILNVVVNALNHAFFTLSIGIGSMAIFGSYIGRDRALLGEALHVTALDTGVALCAGLVILPACFAFGIAPGQGPGLIFVTLPAVFSHMAGGRFWGTLFFLFMGFAAFSTVLAVFECVLASLRDFTGWSRRRACAALALAIPLLSLPCVLGFNVWSGFHPLGGGSGILDLEDFLVSDLLLPLGGVGFALYCTHRFGWGWERFRAEANAGRGPQILAALRGYCAWVLPILVLAITVAGLLHRFAGLFN